MIKENLAISLILLVFFIFSGCRLYSWVVLENPEFPDAMLPIDLDANLLKKYSVGDVIVHPRILYTDGTQTTQGVFVMFFSRTNTSVASIKALTLYVNRAELEYGKQIVSDSASGWELYPANNPFYVCSIDGAPIELSKPEIVKGKVNLFLTVLVKKENGKVIEKKIESCFLPKKRSYLE